MNEWIKCSERLPNLYDFVLVCANFQGTGEPKPIQIARRSGGWADNECWEFVNTIQRNNVTGAWMDIEYPMNMDDITHWMPLPEPPHD